LLCSLAAPRAKASDLQWRRGRPPAAQAVSSANAEARAAASAQSTPATGRGVVARQDAAVRPAAWQGEPTSQPPSPFGAGDQGSMRSLVVRETAPVVREDNSPAERGEAFVAAQPGQSQGLPAGGGGGPAGLQVESFLETPTERQPAGQGGLGTPGGDRGLDLGTLPLPQEREALPAERPTMQPLDEPLPPRDAAADAAQLARERQQAEAYCSQELADLRASTLADVSLDIRLVGTAGRDFPFECSLDDGTWHPGRAWPETVYMWKASALCHKPLYFEDEAMERYGHSWGPCCDPLVAGVHFFTKLPVLPYCMGLEPPCECVYALGHYRPGSCAPYMIDPVPLSARAALFQAGAVVGAAAILP
jgi:hypothetical protein